MANKVLIDELDGTPAQITFADIGTDYNPTAANDLRHASATDVEAQLDLTDVADGAARQSTKVDLGAIRSAYSVRACFELAATPTAGDVIEVYWAPSQHATAANGNPGGVSGADSAYTGDSSNLAAAVRQLQLIGVFVCTEAPTAEGVQVAEIGILVPTERYGSLVVKNESAAAFHSDAVESHVVFDPLYTEVQ